MAKTRVIAVTNQKGGVGKTTTAGTLAVGLALDGKKVAAVDMDPQGNLTMAFGIRTPDEELKETIADVLEQQMRFRESDVKKIILRNREGVDLIPANIRLSEVETLMIMAQNRENLLKKSLQPLMEDYDYIIIDCPPSLSILTINVFAMADEVLIPVQAEYFSAKGMVQLIRTVFRIKEDINPALEFNGILLTLYEKRTILSNGIRDVIQRNFGKNIRIYETVIPRNVRLGECPKEGKSIFSYSPRSKGAAAYRLFVKEFIHGHEEF